MEKNDIEKDHSLWSKKDVFKMYQGDLFKYTQYYYVHEILVNITVGGYKFFYLKDYKSSWNK